MHTKWKAGGKLAYNAVAPHSPLDVSTMDPPNSEITQEDDPVLMQNVEGMFMLDLFRAGNVAAVVDRITTKAYTTNDLTRHVMGVNLSSAACRAGNLEVVDLILTATDFTSIPDYELFPIIGAIANKHERIVRRLLAAIPTSATIALDHKGNTALHIAVKCGAGAVVHELLPHSNVNASNRSGRTPLHMAVRRASYACVDALVNMEARVDAVDKNGDTPLHRAAAKPRRPLETVLRMLDRLFRANASVEVRNTQGLLAVDLASSKPLQEIRDAIAAEAEFRKRFPRHCLARNGNFRQIDQWLASIVPPTDVPFTPVPGTSIRDQEVLDGSMQLRLVRCPNETQYRFLGINVNTTGKPWTVVGAWSVRDNSVSMVQSYALGDSQYARVTFVGPIDVDTGIWTATFLDAANQLTGINKYTFPLWSCLRCNKAKLPIEGSECLSCMDPGRTALELITMARLMCATAWESDLNIQLLECISMLSQLTKCPITPQAAWTRAVRHWDQTEKSYQLVAAKQRVKQEHPRYYAVNVETVANAVAFIQAGQSALLLAALHGHETIVRELLLHLADLNLSPSTTVASVLASASPRPPMHDDIQEILATEALLRVKSNEHRAKIAKRLRQLGTEEALTTNGFANALTSDPGIASGFLSDCVKLDRHEVCFTEMEHIFGRDYEYCVHYHLFDLETNDPILIDRVQTECMEHITMLRLLQIKWELFGRRAYLQQCLINLLLLILTTISCTLSPDGAPNTAAFGTGAATLVFVAVSYGMVQWLRPRPLWRLARLTYDRSFEFDPDMKIPKLRARKSLVKQLLVVATFAITLLLVVPILWLLLYFELIDWFPATAHALVGLAALYFLYIQRQEATSDMEAVKKSRLARLQLLLYLIIVCVYVPMKLHWLDASTSVQTGLGSIITIVLWVLSLQFLKVVPAVSFLLPMVGDLLVDVGNFFIFFGVVQVGLALTFYQLFREKDVKEFSTLWQSFVTTYFVTFGNVPLDAISSFDPETESFLTACATLLFMCQSATIVLLLINVLLAMMNKTVDVGLNRAKSQALSSYAQSILHLEMSQRMNKSERMDLMDFRRPSLKEPAGLLNPIFTETLPRAEWPVSAEDDAALTEYAASKEAPKRSMEAAKCQVDDALDAFEATFVRVGHFTPLDVKSVFRTELTLFAATRARTTDLFASATDGPTTSVRVQREVAKLRDAIIDLWQPDVQGVVATTPHGQCVLLYQLSHQATLKEMAKRMLVTIANIFAPAQERVEAPVSANDEIASLKSLLNDHTRLVQTLLLEMQGLRQQMETTTAPKKQRASRGNA
ncbi:hypothetical protein SDRG_11148 [Saprolegnia diclina VS20]|uniref:Ion transport domain-containing protein n=1 Tax=Saprolegnia diclina (strain VS20) TaxID=1156394 RepID=T0PP00_SAPDV|nr:hypothetical protein SDRG_11148 [Saprolegnia diclina VS20]XP_008619445.1 hypothetical protein SDRG_15061 [Saprolegnia diclina VS20]EQC27159.1 hypothetical protein SDRG_15061 [Saprolegnia diclina VS20]EQC31225.1 hypothetical protein SDRG_11148 [Saprolegnia diclina VS20]|eukprot:XP_008615398.1 hypothetical protein SDRG_11148 [Saprolegnia diclina VS20]